jgi:AraC-like DNA-binding protein
VKGQRFEKLTDVAYDNGFADQSHFIRSFREFTNVTPNTYLRSLLSGKRYSLKQKRRHKVLLIG